MKRTFDEVITELDMAKERINEFEHMSLVISKTEKRERNEKYGAKYPRMLGQLQNV